MGGGPASVARPKAHSVRLIYDVSRSSRTKIMRPESSVSFSSAIARCDPSPPRVCQQRTMALEPKRDVAAVTQAMISKKSMHCSQMLCPLSEAGQCLRVGSHDKTGPRFKAWCSRCHTCASSGEENSTMPQPLERWSGPAGGEVLLIERNIWQPLKRASSTVLAKKTVPSRTKWTTAKKGARPCRMLARVTSPTERM